MVDEHIWAIDGLLFVGLRTGHVCGRPINPSLSSTRSLDIVATPDPFNQQLKVILLQLVECTVPAGRGLWNVRRYT
jgi:hypothetical protein